MSIEKKRIQHNYQECLDKVAKGGKAPPLKSKHQSSFGSKVSRISVPDKLY